MEFIATGIGLPLAYVAILVAALAAIVFSLVFMFRDLKKAKSALIGVGALIVVFGLLWLTADSNPVKLPGDEVFDNGGQLKIINAGMLSMYILLIASVVAALYSAVSSFFKK